jgi:tRNA threonylcarbamoyl adenosine modification protein YeaZ
LGSDAPLILAIDTSAALCAAAVVAGDAVLASASEEMGKGQAERLFPMIDEVLSAAGKTLPDLDAIAVCTGPGNFTGVRIGVSAARGLALALARPAIGVTRLEALAHGATVPTVATVAGPRGQVYAQVFDAAGSALTDPAAGAPAEIAPRLAPARPGRAIGASAETLANLLGCATGPVSDSPAPEILARIAAARLDAPGPRSAPLYLRPADAAPSSARPLAVSPDYAAAAAIHAAAFTAVERGWSADEIRALAERPGGLFVQAPAGFALGQVIADEAEILTIAIRPDRQNRGDGRALLAAFEIAAAGRGASRIFLDVAEDNLAARALYSGAGYSLDGRRRGYYRRPDGGHSDALLMSKLTESPG